MIFVCKQCGKEFIEKYSKYSSGDFCCRKCASKYSHSFINKEKLSKKMKKMYEMHPNKFSHLLSKEIKEKQLKTFNETIKKRIMDKPWNELSEELVKRRLIYEQNGKCNKCGLSEWLGKPISLELEHKDGNHYNNSRENVELLCPNCHSQTDTYRGRNVNKLRKKYTDEELLEAYIKEGTICKALKSLGMASKGKNYERFMNCLLKYGYNVEKVNGRYKIIGH